MTTSNQQLANPTALGLLGFGITTLLLNLHNVGLFTLDSTILAMGIFYGGLAQIIAGLIDFKRNNMFGATAFTSYGLFWMALVAIKTNVLGVANDSESMVAFFFMWGLLTLVFFIGTLKGKRSLQVVFLSLTALFFALAIGTSMDSELAMQIAGVIGVISGGAAFYTAAAEILNEQYAKPVLPM